MLSRRNERLLPDKEISDSDLADLAARTSASHNLEHYHYGLLGGRILATHIQSTAKTKFSEAMEQLRFHKDQHGESPLISDETYVFVVRHRDALDSAIRRERDLDLPFSACVPSCAPTFSRTRRPGNSSRLPVHVHARRGRHLQGL